MFYKISYPFPGKYKRKKESTYFHKKEILIVGALEAHRNFTNPLLINNTLDQSYQNGRDSLL